MKRLILAMAAVMVMAGSAWGFVQHCTYHRVGEYSKMLDFIGGKCADTDCDGWCDTHVFCGSWFDCYDNDGSGYCDYQEMRGYPRHPWEPIVVEPFDSWSLTLEELERAVQVGQ